MSPFPPALALVEEERLGELGSSPSHFSPSSQPDSPSQKVQRPRGCFACRPAYSRLHLSSRARVSVHQRVEGTGAFHKCDPKVQQGQVNKDTKTN